MSNVIRVSGEWANGIASAAPAGCASASVTAWTAWS